MDYIIERKNMYKIGDIVLIEYWWDNMITPVEILSIKGRSYRVSHNNKWSKIHNAPIETIKSYDIIDKFKVR